MLVVLFFFLSSQNILAGNLKGYGNVQMDLSTREALAQFQDASFPDLLAELRSKNSGEINSFQNLKCSRDDIPKGMKINIVYEVHGRSKELDAAKTRLLRDAVQDKNSFLLLESDTGKSPRRQALHRTLIKYGIRDRYNGLKTVRGMDSDLQLRNIWFIPSQVQMIKTDPQKGVESLLEEMIANPRLANLLKRVYKDPKNDEETKKALKQLLLMHKASSSVQLLHTGDFAGMAARIPHKKKLIDVLEKVAFIEHEEHQQKYSPKAGYCPPGSAYAAECLNRGIGDVILDAGFNKRDQVFVNEIGNALCDASKMGIKKVNISVGAGHKDNLLAGLRRALKEQNLQGRVSLDSTALEDWYPVGSTIKRVVAPAAGLE